MTLEELLQHVTTSKLVSDQALAEIGRMVADTPGASVESIASYLVSRGELTIQQAARLTVPPGAPAPPSSPFAPPAAKGPWSAGTTTAPTRAFDDDDLRLADEEDYAIEHPLLGQPSARGPSTSPPIAGATDLMSELEPLDDAAGNSAKAARPPAARPGSGLWRDELKPPRSRASSKAKPPAPANPDQTIHLDPSDILSEDLLDDASPLATTAPGGIRPPQAAPSKPRPHSKASLKRWDSPLLLVGGGVLLGLLILGYALFFAVQRETGDQVLEQANDDYAGGAYTQAIHRYTRYLDAFPEHAGVSQARVRRGLAQLRQAVEGTRNWPRALETAREVLDQIASERAFLDSSRELAALLPAIAEGLAEQARQSPETATLEAGRESLILVGKWVPAALRPEQTLRDVEASLALTERALAKGESLKAAIAAIDQAAADNTPTAAYEIRRRLLTDYPDAERDAALVASMSSVAKAEQKAARQVAEARDAETAPAETHVLYSWTAVMAEPIAGVAAARSDAIVVVGAEGYVAALDAAGQVLWRRFVGLDAPHSIRAGASPTSDWIVSDVAHGELSRIDARSGEPKWRLPIGDVWDAPPVVSGSTIWLPTREGRLWMIEAETGRARGFTQFAQPLCASPAVKDGVCYQLAEQAVVYSVSARDGACTGATYLGHQRDAIRVPPLGVGPFLFVAENFGQNDCHIRVFVTDESGASLSEVQQVRIQGHVLAPLAVGGRTLVAATMLGSVYAFQINQASDSEALTRVAHKPVDDAAPVVQYPAMVGATVCVAGRGLTLFDVQSVRGRLDPRFIAADQHIFLGPPLAAGDLLVSAGTRAGWPGAVVTAIDSKSARLAWQTKIAAPLAGAPVASSDGTSLTSMSSIGGLYDVPTSDLAGALGSAVANQPSATIDLLQPLASRAAAVELDGGRLAFAPDLRKTRADIHWLLVVEPKGRPERLRALDLADALAAPPTRFEAGMAIPTHFGQVLVFDADLAVPLLAPFQPPLSPSASIDWTRAARYGNGGLLIGDGRKMLYRLGRVDQPRAHLAALAQAPFPAEHRELAVCGSTAYVVDASHTLGAFRADTLEPIASWPMSGRVSLGPVAIGGMAYVATEMGELLAFNATGEPAWRALVDDGPVVGAADLDGDILVASASGRVVRLAAGSGEIKAAVDVGEPLTGGLVRVGDRVAATSGDGSLLVIAAP